MQVNDDELEGSGDLVYYNGTLFTGTAVDFHSNGTKALEVSYVNGLPDGYWKEWAVSGALLVEHVCKDGLRHGPTKLYFEDGKAKVCAEYEFGIETSYAEWDRNGRQTASRVLGPDTAGANYALLLKRRADSEQGA